MMYLAVFSRKLTHLFAAFSVAALSLNGVAYAADKSADGAVTIGALASGQVTKLYVKEGQAVKAGDPLLTLDSSRYLAKKNVLQSQIKMTKLDMDDAKIELNQAVDLFDRTVTSRRTLDASQLRYDRAKAAYDKANAELQLHRAWSKYVYVKAPFTGTIEKIHTPLGATVFKENTPMIEMTP